MTALIVLALGSGAVGAVYAYVVAQARGGQKCPQCPHMAHLHVGESGCVACSCTSLVVA